MAALRIAVVATLVAVSLGRAQIQIDDRPKVLETKPLTKEELKREEAELLLRHARSLYGIAVFRQRHDKLLEATSTLEKAAHLDPNSLEIRRALISLYASIGRDDEATKLCREVLDREPHDVETAHQFAKLLKEEGKPAEAIPVLQKAVACKAAAERPERLLFMLSDLCELLLAKGDFAAESKAQQAIIHTITEKREQLLYGNGFTRDDLTSSLARSYERLGRARIQLKEYDQAIVAFRNARDTLLKSDDPECRTQAVRLNWNLCKIAAAQGQWAEAMTALDAYLQHGPTEMEPYEKKIELLRKLGRDREVIPTLQRYAAREEFHLGLQLLLAREMAKEPRMRRAAETQYLTLLRKNIRPDIYRGLFKLYEQADEMGKVLDLIDKTETVLKAKEGEVKAEERESAAERNRAMLIVLRSEPPLVTSLIRQACDEVGRDQQHEPATWTVLAYLAARAHKLPEAETLFRRCIADKKGRVDANTELAVYEGLMAVLTMQRKYKDVVTLCRELLASRKLGGVGVDQSFHSEMAAALAELGQYDEALIHSDDAIKASSDEWKVRRRCEKAAILGQAERYKEAIRECLDIMKEFPQQKNVMQARYTLSNIYSLKSDHEKSEEQLRLILEVDPDAHLANNNLGYQMADRSVNLDEAERLIRRAIETDRFIRKETGEAGDNAAYVDSLGWVLFRKGKLNEAREWLEKAIALPDGADDPSVWDHLGDVYAKANLIDKAKEAWTTSLHLYDTGRRRNSESKRAEVVKKLATLGD